MRTWRALVTSASASRAPASRLPVRAFDEPGRASPAVATGRESGFTCAIGRSRVWLREAGSAPCNSCGRAPVLCRNGIAWISGGAKVGGIAKETVPVRAAGQAKASFRDSDGNHLHIDSPLLECEDQHRSRPDTAVLPSPVPERARTPRRSPIFGMGTLDPFESSRLPDRLTCCLVMSRDVNRPNSPRRWPTESSLLPTRHPAGHSPSGNLSYAAVTRCALRGSCQVLAFVAALPGFQDMPAATRATPIAASTFFAHSG